MAAMRAGAMHHLALKSKDPRSLATFYARTLGLIQTATFDDEHGLRSVWLGLDGAILMIERSAQGEPANGEDPPGLHLFALKIGADERRAWRAHLAQAGVEITGTTPYTLYIQDPEGNRIGLSSWPQLGRE